MGATSSLLTEFGRAKENAEARDRGDRADEAGVCAWGSRVPPSQRQWSVVAADGAERQIRGAPPPTVLDGIVREATKSSAAAKALFKGEFCGHGEPTMTIFDVVIDGAEELDVSVIPNPEDTGRNVIALVARKPGGPWVTLYKREWEEAQSTLEGVRPAPLTKAELAAVSSDVERARVAIGFEYPCDATSRDCVSWMTIDLLFATKKKPMCLVDSELA